MANVLEKRTSAIEVQISVISQRQQTLDEAEGVDPVLVIHALESSDYEQLICAHNPNALTFYPGCGAPQVLSPWSFWDLRWTWTPRSKLRPDAASHRESLSRSQNVDSLLTMGLVNDACL